MENGISRPVLTGRIDLGHILTACLLLVAIVVPGFAAYFTIENQISMNSQNIAIVQQQQAQTIKWMQQIQDEQRQFTKDMASNLIKITETLTDLRILFAQVRDGVRK